MNEELFRMLELSQQGFCCSQILLIMGLEAQGKSNPDLVRSMHGLKGGMDPGKNCGSLTGGCCLLALYAGKGTPEEKPSEHLNEMLRELVEWFQQEYGTLYGGINCSDILENDITKQKERCPQLVFQTYEKVKEILEAHGYDMSAQMEAEQ